MNQEPNETTLVVAENALITAIEVSDEDERMNFLPKHYSKYFMSFEENTYRIMTHMNRAYTGGTWKFMELSNGAGFMSWDSDKVCKMTHAGNYFSGDMSAEAASITVALFNLSAAGEITDDESFWIEYRKLQSFACQHAEADMILRAID